MFLPLNIVNASVLQSTGETKLYMNLYFITGPISLLAVIISIPFGVMAMAWATLIAGVLYYLVFSIVIGRKIGYRYYKQLWDWRKIFFALALMSAGVLLSVHWINGMWAKFAIGFAVGTAIYLLCCVTFNLLDKDILKIVKSKIGKK
jgi:O-antigen/teichoic acid export membrane protein